MSIIIIVMIAYLVGLAGFDHIIAGSTKALFSLASKTISFGSYLTHFFVPALLGNLVGGVSWVAVLGHAQVAGPKS